MVRVNTVTRFFWFFLVIAHTEHRCHFSCRPKAYQDQQQECRGQLEELKAEVDNLKLTLEKRCDSSSSLCATRRLIYRAAVSALRHVSITLNLRLCGRSPLPDSPPQTSSEPAGESALCTSYQQVGLLLASTSLFFSNRLTLFLIFVRPLFFAVAGRHRRRADQSRRPIWTAQTEAPPLRAAGD